MNLPHTSAAMSPSDRPVVLRIAEHPSTPILNGMPLLSRFATLLFACVLHAEAADFDIRAHGAKGDGVTIDSPAINRAIEAASAAGGGTVVFPAGTYLSFSVRLKSNITLAFESGATLLAATPSAALGGYDQAEPNEWGDKLQYQDFGHSHWHNSLIWGENLENISIIGPGRIDGTKGLVRNAGSGGGGRGAGGPNGTVAPSTPDSRSTSPVRSIGPIVGNKAIALKRCRNVLLRDISIRLGGHFALLATGVDQLTIDHVNVDTNRDGFDIDACRHVRISNCSVNAPHDDAIVLKSSYALGEARPCEDVTITNCAVTGFDAGSFFDGTYQRTMERAPDRDGPTGRIKFGTESNGGFRNITISNCTFERSRGLALETVDGGVIEDIAITNITMRDVTTAPIFLRLGNRARGPEGTPVGAIRRVVISHLTVSNADPRYPSLIAGLPGHPIEDISLSDIRITHRGGLTLDQVAQQPAELVNTFFLRGPGLTGPRDAFAPPEQEKAYPEPSMFGLLPAHALYVRHAKNISVRDFSVAFATIDTRPAIVLDDVATATFDRTTVQHAPSAPTFTLRHVTDFNARSTPGLADTTRPNAENESL
jgi:polygalacturonase